MEQATTTTQEPTEQKFVLAGACRQGNEIQTCALTRHDCGHDTIFLSARQTLHAGEDCSATDRLFGGRCKGSNVCVANSDGCISGHHFRRSDTCTLSADLEIDTPTPYGKCVAKEQEQTNYDSNIDNNDNSFCAWDRRDCGTTHTWRDHSGDCNCPQVRTGACRYIHTNEYVCAVSKDACETDHHVVEFLTVHQLMTNRKHNHIDCRLCAVHAETANIPTNIEESALSKSSSSSAVGPVLGFLVLVAGVAVWYRKRQQQKSQTSCSNNQSIPAIEFSDAAGSRSSSEAEEDSYAVTLS